MIRIVIQFFIIFEYDSVDMFLIQFHMLVVIGFIVLAIVIRKDEFII